MRRLNQLPNFSRIFDWITEALVLGSIAELREREGSFTSRRLMVRTGIRHVSDRTARRLLNRKGYFFLQARKKGLMPE